MGKTDIYITHAVRTPIAKIGKSLAGVSELELGAFIIRELVHNRAKIAVDKIDQIILGNVKQSSNPANIARVAALSAGLPDDIPAITVHRQCGSGLQAIMDAHAMISAGAAEVVLAGGVENMSHSAYFMRNTANGLGSGNFTIEDSLTAGGPGAVPKEMFGDLPMGITAENVGKLYGITREEQDAFGYESQVRAANAIKEGRFKEQIVPVPVDTPDGEKLFDTDEHPFLSSLEKLAALRPAFTKDGSVTAGNSSGRNDGASAVLVMTGAKAEELGYKPVARIVSSGASGCDPKLMGLGPVESTRKALEQAGLVLKDIDVIELNEAFAAQSLGCIIEWEKTGLTRAQLMEKINPNGGAIALGHPLGCTGAALTTKCVYELLRVPEKRYGLITLCCAGGLGVALIIEKGSFND